MARPSRLPRLLDPAAACGLAALVAVLLWPSLRPGRTVVPADVLTYVTPWRVLAGGPRAHNPIVSDAGLQFFPWLAWFGRAWRASGGVPAWNPLILGGVPVSPSGFVAPDYPGFWLARVLDPFDAYNVFVAAHLVVAAVGVYAFARVLGASRPAGWVAGAGALGAATWVHWSLHLVHLVGMAWLPAAVAAAHRAVVAPSRRSAATLGLVFGLWWLGGNPQYALFGTLALLAYSAALLAFGTKIALFSGPFLVPKREGRGAVAAVGTLGVGLALGAALAAPSLLPAADYGGRILRDREPVSATAEAHLPAWHLARLVVADAAGDPVGGLTIERNPEYVMDSPAVGVAVLVLAAAGAAAGWRRPAVAAAAACGVGALVLAFTPWPHHVLHAVVPGYDRFRVGARWTAVAPAFALPLAALGLDALAGGCRRARLAVVVGAGVAAGGAVTWWGAAHRFAVPIGWARFAPALLVPVVVAGAAWVAGRRGRAAGAMAAACVVGEVVVGFPRWYPSVREADAYPAVAVARVAAERGGRIIRLGLRRSTVSTFAADVPMAYGVADAQGVAVLFPRAWDRFLRLLDDYGDYARAANTAPDVRGLRDARTPLLDVADVRTVVAESNVPVPVGLRPADGGEPRVYARDGGEPAMLVPLAEPATPARAWAALGRPEWDPRRRAAVVGLASAVRGGPGRVRLLGAGPGWERWAVAAPEGGFLRVGAAYDPGWAARIDGRPARVLAADGPFRGVVVPPGRHEVVFRYRNRPAERGRLVALGALLGLAALAALRVGRRRADTVR